MKISTSSKRLEGEMKYDYCARRLLEKHRLAILRLGRPVWVSHQMVKAPDGTLAKAIIQGTYKKAGKNRKLIGKKERKAYKKARRAFKFASQL